MLQSLTKSERETKIAGRSAAHPNISVFSESEMMPAGIGLFFALLHLTVGSEDILYNGMASDDVRLCEGSSRVSLCRIGTRYARHRPYLPYRDCFSSDVLPIILGEIHSVVESLRGMWGDGRTRCGVLSQREYSLIGNTF